MICNIYIINEYNGTKLLGVLAMNRKYSKHRLSIEKIVGIILGSIGLFLVISSIPVRFLLLVVGIALIAMAVLLLTIK